MYIIAKTIIFYIRNMQEKINKLNYSSRIFCYICEIRISYIGILFINFLSYFLMYFSSNRTSNRNQRSYMICGLSSCFDTSLNANFVYSLLQRERGNLILLYQIASRPDEANCNVNKILVFKDIQDIPNLNVKIAGT